MAVDGAPEVKSQGTMRVIDELRRMIVAGELLPGQQIRQESMAERLGVSRLPIREGLRQLTSDGLVSHTPNVGYMVARISQTEFDQIYLMRKVLEDVVIKHIPLPTDAQIAAIVDLNDAVIEAAESLDLVTMRYANTAFHFGIFRLSGLEFIINEIEKLWTWASPYHAVYLFSSDSRQAVLAEHAQMIDALKAGENERLSALMDQHRHGSETQIGMMLGGGGMVRPTAD